MQKKSIDLVFDLDGVLLDSESDLSWLAQALRQTLQDLNVPITQRNLEQLYPVNLQEFRLAARSFDINPETLWEIRDMHYTQEKLAAIESGLITPFDDIDTLYSVIDTYSLHIISNSPQIVVDSFINNLGYDDLFEIGIGRGNRLTDLKKLKPEPYFYEELIRQDSPDNQYLYIGDTQTDRQFAESTGMEFALISRAGDGGTSIATLVNQLC